MQSRITTFLFIGAFYLFIDMLTYFDLKLLFSDKWLRPFQFLYLLSSLYVFYSFYCLYQTIQTASLFRDASYNFYLGIIVTAVVSKVVFLSALLLQDGGRWLFGGVKYLADVLNIHSQPVGEPFLPQRRKFMTALAAGVASIPLFGILYGITKGKYKYTVNKVTLNFPDLPAAFDGFKVVQLSDIHAGSLDSLEEVARGVKMVNDQNPDLVVFTGDLVNSNKDEVNPFMPIFKDLKAKYGKYAVLGNHDYYGVPRSGNTADIQNYWQDFFSKYETMGFQLLNNEGSKLEKEGDYLQILGVENWGAGRWFPKRGDLDQTLVNCDKDDFCLLLSHDPTHWDEKVLAHPKHIHLTLSGHTHGMQFGINMPGFKWSPAQYRYPRWMGLYKEKDQYLYVNRGFGFLAFPGRVGMWPEITVIELKMKNEELKINS